MRACGADCANHMHDKPLQTFNFRSFSIMVLQACCAANITSMRLRVLMRCHVGAWACHDDACGGSVPLRVVCWHVARMGGGVE